MTNHQDKELSREPTLQQVVAFLLGEGVLDGMGFGDSDTANPKPRYWWRKHLRAAFATSPQLPVAEQPAGQAVDTKEWLRQESSVYALNERGVNSDYINVQQADNRHDRAATNDLAERIRMLLSRPLSPVAQMSGDAKFINWVADRFVHVYGEPENVDFVLKLRRLAASHPSNAATVPPVQAPSDSQAICDLIEASLDSIGVVGVEAEYVLDDLRTALKTAPQPVAAPIVPSDEQIIALANESDMPAIATVDNPESLLSFARALLTTASNAGEDVKGGEA